MRCPAITLEEYLHAYLNNAGIADDAYRKRTIAMTFARCTNSEEKRHYPTAAIPLRNEKFAVSRRRHTA